MNHSIGKESKTNGLMHLQAARRGSCLLCCIRTLVRLGWHCQLKTGILPGHGDLSHPLPLKDLQLAMLGTEPRTFFMPGMCSTPELWPPTLRARKANQIVLLLFITITYHSHSSFKCLKGFTSILLRSSLQQAYRVGQCYCLQIVHEWGWG